MNDEPFEWEVEETGKLRDLAIEIAERHDADRHGGERCDTNRVGLLAFLAHGLGLGPTDVETLPRAITFYEDQHRRRRLRTVKGNGDLIR